LSELASTRIDEPLTGFLPDYQYPPTATCVGHHMLFGKAATFYVSV